MIKAEGYATKLGADKIDYKVNVVAGVNNDLTDIARKLFRVELLAIFETLYKLDPGIIDDALELFVKEVSND